MIPVLVISLERSADRRAYISEHLGALGVPFRFVNAIDGADLPATVRARYEPTMPQGAMGCAESHLAALREIAEGQNEFVCVLEDDAELSADALPLMKPAILKTLGPFDVLRFEARVRKGRRLAIPLATIGGIDLVATYRHKIAMTAQIFSREGARKIVRRISFLRVALDVAIFLDAYVMGLRIIETRPEVASPRDLPSTIGPGRKPPYSSLERFLLRHVRVREIRGILSFVKAWGIGGLMRVRLC